MYSFFFLIFHPGQYKKLEENHEYNQKRSREFQSPIFPHPHLSPFTLLLEGGKRQRQQWDGVGWGVGYFTIFSRRDKKKIKTPMLCKIFLYIPSSVHLEASLLLHDTLFFSPLVSLSLSHYSAVTASGFSKVQGGNILQNSNKKLFLFFFFLFFVGSSSHSS